MKLYTILALIAPVFAITMLASAVAYGETPAEHAAALIKAPMTACVARPLTQGTVGSTVQVCAVRGSR